ncbi:MAG: type II secretion system F family protein [Coriobacteriia bacterium]|nr:type II secretion system F family protein [Coriobacteriia bacterium]MBN2821963.1 type II secretion system F family protein [Coriobacteriia bacterium]
MDLIATVVAGAAVALFVYAGLSLLAPEERKVKRRLAGLSEFEAEQAAEAEPLLQPFAKRVVVPAVSLLSDVVRHISPGDYGARVRQRLVSAGNPSDMTAEVFIAAKIVSAVAAGVTCFLVMYLLGASRVALVVFCMVSIAVGFFAPDLWLKGKESRRRAAIRRALPDMLDMLTISVEAGLGFDAAVAKLVANSTGPLAQEFARTLQEIQAGIPRAEAFRHLSARVDVTELSTFVTSMVQADVFGISVANVLRSQAKEMRTKRRQHAEEAAQKAPVKLVFPLVLCILPATLIVILGPAIVSIGKAFGLIN